LQLIQNQNKGRESCVIPVIPCCAIGGGQHTTKSGIRKNSVVHLRGIYTLVMLNYLIKYFMSQSRFIIHLAMLFSFQIYVKWKHICSTSYKIHKLNLCLNSYVLYSVVGETSPSIIPPYVLHCCDDVPDDGDMAEICCACLSKNECFYSMVVVSVWFYLLTA
jgi:hypothetical protein